MRGRNVSASLGCQTKTPIQFPACDLRPSQLTKESTVVLAKGSAPNVKLDDKFYKLVDKMEVRRRPPLLMQGKP